MKLYRVVDWEENFEVAQSKRIQKALPWVALPTKHDGKSYRRVMRLEDGPSVYCAWVLILQVAAKCDQRGVLADSDGPLSAEDLEIKTDCPAELFERAFEVLSDPKIGWLSATQWGANVEEINRPSTTLNRPSTVVNQPLTTLRTRTDITDGHNEQDGRTDITDGQTNMVDSIDRSTEATDSPDDLEDVFSSNPASKQIAKSVRTNSKADRELLALVGLLISSKQIPEGWAFDAAAAVEAKGESLKRPIGYFRSCLGESCEKAGMDLSKLLRGADSNRPTGPPPKGEPHSPFAFPEPKSPL